MNDIEKYTESVFDSIKHIEEDGGEFWTAREPQKALDYTEWRKFEVIIKKAIISCDNSNIPINNHFAEVCKMINLAKGAQREIKD